MEGKSYVELAEEKRKALANAGPRPYVMSEKEKMLRNMVHDPVDPEIEDDRARVLDLCYEFNGLRPSETEKQGALLKRILPNANGPYMIAQPLIVDLGYNTYVGSGFKANYGLMIFDYAKVTFGDRVYVGPKCMFATSMHPRSSEKRNTYLINALPITVGDDVWIGACVKVLAGVTIGSNVIIGAGSVVSKDIPDNCYAEGNPCKVVRKLSEC